ncbi:MAG: MurR/RpiR family transcriptional regulator [Blautia sp.]|nr:MurR/RpiR family transcriptional regulator [Blautia sp.]
MEDFKTMDREVLEVIREKYEDIFPAEKKAVDFVLGNPTEAVGFNVSELARASGVSDATIVRMCHHLGYSGYYQFRLALSRDIGKKQYGGSLELHPNEAIRQVFDGYAASVSAILRDLDTENLQECISLIKNADTVHLIAVGNTTNITEYMGFRLERLGIRSTYSSLPEYFMNHINLADRNDIVLAVSKSGSSKRVLDGMKLAKEKELPIILITSHENSEATSLADHVLNSRGTEEHENYYKGYSYLNEIILVETILNFVVNEELIEKKRAGRPELILAGNKG